VAPEGDLLRIRDHAFWLKSDIGGQRLKCPFQPTPLFIESKPVKRRRKSIVELLRVFRENEAVGSEMSSELMLPGSSITRRKVSKILDREPQSQGS
jgi:hypothetical protein